LSLSHAARASTEGIYKAIILRQPLDKIADSLFVDDPLCRPLSANCWIRPRQFGVRLLGSASDSPFTVGSSSKVAAMYNVVLT
jgi:hypothetical protein